MATTGTAALSQVGCRKAWLTCSQGFPLWNSLAVMAAVVLLAAAAASVVVLPALLGSASTIQCLLPAVMAGHSNPHHCLVEQHPGGTWRRTTKVGRCLLCRHLHLAVQAAERTINVLRSCCSRS